MPGKLVLTRKNEWLNRMRPFHVWIDGQERGSVRNGSSEEFPLEPGMHEVVCKVSAFSSVTYSFTVTDNGNAYLRVRSALKYFWPLYALLLIGLLGTLYFRLTHQPVPPNYFIFQLLCIFPCVLYLLYYRLFARKRYLVVDEDSDNVFR
jgi:hypothetical protein